MYCVKFIKIFLAEFYFPLDLKGSWNTSLWCKKARRGAWSVWKKRYMCWAKWAWKKMGFPVKGGLLLCAVNGYKHSRLFLHWGSWQSFHATERYATPPWTSARQQQQHSNRRACYWLCVHGRWKYAKIIPNQRCLVHGAHKNKLFSL
jgi:hypothetical protein